MSPLRLLRMAWRARRPAPERQVLLVLGVIAACLLLALAEWLGWLPGWMAMPR